MGVWRQEWIYIFRRIVNSPGVTFAIVASIALGIAANATIFAIVSTFVLKPPPVGDPATLMSLHTTRMNEPCCNHFPWPVYVDVRDQARSFSGVAAFYELLPASIGGSGEPERVWGQAATSNFFDVAQLPMTLGRGFHPNEERQQVIVLGHRLWQRRFASDPAVLGKTVTLSGRTFTVVGVAGPGFHGVDLLLDPEFWVPLGNVEQMALNIPKRDERGNNWLAVIGRLQPGVTHTQADAELDTIAKRFAVTYQATDKDLGFRFEQAGSVPPRERSAVLLFLGGLMVVVLLVLCIACANVANLLLAQAASRAREMAVRLALGASRGQLMRQMLAENVVLAVAGGAIGFVLSIWGTSALSAFRLPVPIPLDIGVHTDWRVLLYTLALSMGTGLLFGLTPAWMASRPILTSALKGEDALARPGRKWTLRNVLVVGQLALSLVLLCVTGLFLRSLQRASTIDIGFRSRGLLMMSVDPQVLGYTAAHSVQFLKQLRERVAALPGVSSAVVTDVVPLSMGNRSESFEVVGDEKAVTATSGGAEMFRVSPGYFETMGIPRLAGRDFANESVTGPPVAVISRLFAEHLFGKENPVGRQIRGGGVTYRIVGEVADVKSRTLGEDLRPVLFRSLDQSIGSDPSFLGYTLVVRGERDLSGLTAAVRGEVRSLDPAMAVYNVKTIEEHLREALILPRLAGTLFGVFGFIGLTLASIGLYGVMSYSVSRRRREIGIRMALGAQIGSVQRMIVGQGMMLAGIAVAIGLPGAWMGAKFAGSFLYGIGPHDQMTFTVVPIVLSAIALLACWIPARRAARVDPQVVLRYE